MTPLDATIVIPAYKRPEALRKAVISVVRQNYPAGRYEVIVVDSSPSEENVEVVKALAQTADCSLRIYRKPPEGPGPSRNLGVREGRGEFIAFMDSDCEASPDWLRHGLAAFNDQVGLVQGRTIPEPGVPRGIFTHYIFVERESFLYETANMFYRRTAFLASGGFPSDRDPHAITPMGGEDAQVAWSVKRAGWQSRFAPEALVSHEVIPIPKKDWIFIKRLYIYPHMTKRIPEIRGHLFGRYFLDKPQALFCLGLAASLLAIWFPVSLLGWLPYGVFRASEPTRSLKGVLRLLRPLVYLSRDTASFGVLLAGSMRFRSLVL